MENRFRGPGQASEKPPIKVLVVDDSAFMRFTIAKYLGDRPEIHVVGAARDGIEALEMIPRLQPDVVTLDVEMPRLNGLSTLREIMAEHPRPVVMLSSLTSDGALETVQALTLGAVDFIAKPANKANMVSIMAEVASKITRAAQARVWAVPRARPVQVAAPQPQSSKTTRPLRGRERVVVIGSSTGGPRALNSVIPALPGDLPAAVLVIQHMPVGFTRSLAERLDSISPLSVKEAEPGDCPEVGRVLVAPGGFHMTLDEHGQVSLNQNPPVHGVRPAVDVTMTAVARQYGALSIGVILTGMGSDGTSGASLIHNAGGKVIAEAESTCVVWGMPRSVVEAGVVDLVVPLGEVAQAIDRLVRNIDA
jgi:two-component system chemotaxis response regulator CheB